MKSVQFTKKNRIKNGVAFLVLLLSLCASTVFAQSTNQLFPTPVTTNEINGTIRARDVGDPRLTTYFYAFNGEQGDIFINVVTANFNGDIDVFTNDGARTLTKIVIYADASDNETGRVIYLRKPEKLLLRVQGRTLNDDPATFRIKFAGSFQAMKDAPVTEEPALPEVKPDTSSGVRVNSVGTIVEVIPKPAPTPKEVPAKAVAGNAKPENTDNSEKKEIVKEIAIEIEEESAVVAQTNPEPRNESVENSETAAQNSENPPVETAAKESKLEEKTATENKTAKAEKRAKTKPVKEREQEAVAEKTEAEKPETTEKTTEQPVEKKAAAAKNKKTKPEKTVAPDPLANVRLLVLFKDGTKIERPMSEILKFGVDKGILTVISKDGTIGRYSMLDVQKMTIE